MKAFKAYDVRGIWGEDLNEDIVYRIGYFLPEVLKTDTILVGRDMRLSSDAMFQALTRGITDRGVNVDSIGLCTTPMVYFATARHQYGGSVMITASHNPSNYNGLKVTRAGAAPVGYDKGLNIVEQYVESEKQTIPTAKKGIVRNIDIRNEYLTFMRQYLVEDLNMNIAVDCSNGMSALLIKDLLGDKPYYINDTADGHFPGHEPNPLESDNQTQLKQLVIEKHSDVGLLFDGDADRITFVDEKGQFVSPDLIIALLGHYFFEERHEKGIVLQDIRTSRAVANYLKKRYNVQTEIWKVGRAFAVDKLRELDGCYGGELAGHYYFRDFFYSDSGILAALIVLRILNKFKKEGRTLSQIVCKISKNLYNSGEINFKIEKKQEAMEAVLNYFMDSDFEYDFNKFLRLLDFDGYRIDYTQYWLNIRPSNTEPYLRFIAEASTEGILRAIVTKTTEIIEEINNRY